MVVKLLKLSHLPDTTHITYQEGGASSSTKPKPAITKPKPTIKKHTKNTDEENTDEEKTYEPVTRTDWRKKGIGYLFNKLEELGYRFTNKQKAGNREVRLKKEQLLEMIYEEKGI